MLRAKEKGPGAANAKGPRHYVHGSDSKHPARSKSGNGATHIIRARAPTDMLAARLYYAELFGWVSFPVPPGTKKSYKSGKHSNGARWGASNDPAVIERDFKKWPKANLGIPTGSENGFFVLEADTPKGHDVDGIASLRRLERKYGRLPKTLMAISPSGSLHYYFRWPKRGVICNSASKIAPSVDVRGEGGMVLGPPSVKAGVGKYRFLNWGTPRCRCTAVALEACCSQACKQRQAPKARCR